MWKDLQNPVIFSFLNGPTVIQKSGEASEQGVYSTDIWENIPEPTTFYSTPQVSDVHFIVKGQIWTPQLAFRVFASGFQAAERF